MTEVVNMKIRKTISYILYAIAFTCSVLASSVKEGIDWFDHAKPFFVIWAICIVLGLVLGYLDNIRRVTYPVFTCICAWVYKHKVFMTKFTRSAYRVYKMQKSSYKRLYHYTQGMFDIYLDAID